MTTYDNSYSRFVAWTKVVLPIVALGILSTLFLFSHTIDPTQSIPYADVDVEELAREQGIGAPNYAGVTNDGSAISVTAKTARPDPDNPQKALTTELVAVIEDTKGGRIEITSQHGIVDAANKTVYLRENVRMLTSSGYSLETSGIVAALEETSLISDGAVSARGPLGTLNAGQMELRLQEGENSGHLLVFKGGVKLVYDPKGG